MRVVAVSKPTLIRAPSRAVYSLISDYRAGHPGTTFTVVPRAQGRESEVTIKTEWEAKGLRGWLERLTAPSVLRRIYAEELAQLGAVAASGD